MFSSLKFKIRRLAQKITGLDADNLEISRMREQIFNLQNELEKVKKDFLFDIKLVPGALSHFTEPNDFFNQESKLVLELVSLGLVNENCKVVELMCGAGIKAWQLKDIVKSYIGYDSSEILINFLKLKIPKLQFTFDKNDLEKSLCDLVIISSSASRWSIISTNYHIEFARKLINPNGRIVIELPYPEVVVADFEKLRYEGLTFLVSKNINDVKVSNLN